jgi:hypothetical protein
MSLPCWFFYGNFRTRNKRANRTARKSRVAGIGPLPLWQFFDAVGGKANATRCKTLSAFSYVGLIELAEKGHAPTPFDRLPHVNKNSGPVCVAVVMTVGVQAKIAISSTSAA